ncbi:zinc-binding dehydrogenase [Baekduia soli]|uniref:zinc-binding dehydrogenase n=1 Tax=Baekduia soli TaxID=496014 RepID=UPI001E5497E9|nr:zinc-binding dehydrogenase [Baekduia soli]
MQTGRAAVLETYHEPLAIREFPLPEPEPGAILVRMEAGTMCGSDLHIWRGELGKSYTIPLPLILGHEMVGSIIAMGAGTDLDSVGTPLTIGDRIIWAGVPCHHCELCTVEHATTLCANRQMAPLRSCAGPPHFLGAFAEYGYISPGAGRLRVPDEVASEWASAGSCALRTCVQAVEKAGRVDFNDSVVVQGAGPLGLFATAILSTHGPRQLIVVGAPDDRLELAREWGATHTISIQEHPTPEARLEAIRSITGGGPRLAFELSGAPGAFAEGVEIVRANGRYVVVGTLGGGPQSIDPSRIVTRGLSVIGSMSGDTDVYSKALVFLRDHRDRFGWDRMLGNRYGLHNVTEGLEAMLSMSEIKPVFDPTLAG